MEPIEVIKNSNKAFVRQKYLIWNGGTDRHTDRQTDPCIELRYVQLTMPSKEERYCLGLMHKLRHAILA